MQHNIQIFSVKGNFTGCIFTHVTLSGASGMKLIILRHLHMPYLNHFSCYECQFASYDILALQEKIAVSQRTSQQI